MEQIPSISTLLSTIFDGNGVLIFAGIIALESLIQESKTLSKYSGWIATLAAFYFTLFIRTEAWYIKPIFALIYAALATRFYKPLSIAIVNYLKQRYPFLKTPITTTLLTESK